MVGKKDKHKIAEILRFDRFVTSIYENKIGWVAATILTSTGFPLVPPIGNIILSSRKVSNLTCKGSGKSPISVRVLQLTLTKGPLALVEFWWMNSAILSFPVPVSPVIFPLRSFMTAIAV